MSDIVEELEEIKRALDGTAGVSWAISASEAVEEIIRLRAENDKLQSLISAVDKGAPIYKAVERILDEKSAWIARPNHEVTEAVALSAGIAWAIYFQNDVALNNFHLRGAHEKLREALITLAEHCNNMEAQNCDYHTMDEGGAPCISEPLANAYAALGETDE